MELLTQLAVDKIGFLLAALAYSVFFLLILVTRVKNLPRLLLLSWALGGVAWALYYSFEQIAPYSTLTSLGLELIRSYLLLLFLLSALNAKIQHLKPFFRARAVWLLSLTLLLWFMLCASSWLTANLIFTGSLVLGVLKLALL